MLTQIINLSEISQLAKDQHFTTVLLCVAIAALVSALAAVWRMAEDKDKRLHDCMQKHLDNARHIEELKDLLLIRKRRTPKT